MYLRKKYIIWKILQYFLVIRHKRNYSHKTKPTLASPKFPDMSTPLGSGYLKHLRRHMRILDFLKCFPLELSPGEDRIVVSKSRLKKYVMWFSPIFESFYLICALTVVRNDWKNKCLGKAVEGAMIVNVILLLNIWSFGVRPNMTAMSVVNSDLKFAEKFKGNDLKFQYFSYARI